MNPTARLIRWPMVAISAALFALAGLACNETEEKQYEAELLPPPLVPEHVARDAGRVVVNLEVIEKEVEIAPDVTYKAWTFNGTVPGPMIRVRVGDTVEVRLANHGEVAHNIDLHAVTGPGGGAGVTTVNAGESSGFTFKAKAPGLYVYHCAAGVVSDHIANGMYGAILVDPARGLPKVDREYYVAQGDVYTEGDTNDPGLQALDMAKLFDERPTYVMFNGATTGVAGDNALQGDVGDRIRIYFINGGPNLTSSFHVIGEIFDRAWNWGAFSSAPVEDVQTITVPPGGATVVDFRLDVPGDYKLVDHALGRVVKGAVGTLVATGDDNFDVFNPMGDKPGGGGHDMNPTPPPANGDNGSNGDNGDGSEAPDETVVVTMTDNRFTPSAITVKAGTTVAFELPNQGKVPHNMRIADEDGDYDSDDSVVSKPDIISPGKTGTLTWKAPDEAGSYPFRCDIHPVDMTGTITVE
jgi:nitrite reductase (NO-forming)